MLIRLHVSVHLAWVTITLLGPPQEAKARYDAEADLRGAREAAVEAASAQQAKDASAMQRRQAATLVIQVRVWCSGYHSLNMHVDVRLQRAQQQDEHAVV